MLAISKLNMRFDIAESHNPKIKDIHLFRDALRKAALQRQKQIKIEKYQPEVKTMNDILLCSNTTNMQQQLLSFYQKDLHLSLTSLSASDLNFRLRSYFLPMLQSLTFEQLLDYGARVQILHESLDMQNDDKQPLTGYIDYLREEIKGQLKAKLANICGQASITLSEVVLMINHLDLLTDLDQSDLADHFDSFVNENDRSAAEGRPVKELYSEIKQQKIEDLFTALDRMNITGVVGSEIDANSLKAYLALVSSKNPIMKPTIEKLNVGMRLGFIALLQNYRADVNATVSDPYKSQKLMSIRLMLGYVEDNTKTLAESMLQVKELFDKNPQIHQMEPLGRFVFRCICSFLNIPYQPPQYNQTLFQGLSSKAEPIDNDSDYKSGYKKVG